MLKNDLKQKNNYRILQQGRLLSIYVRDTQLKKALYING